MIELLNEMNGNFKNKCGSAEHMTDILSLQRKIVEIIAQKNPEKFGDIIANSINDPREYPDLSSFNTSAPSQEAFAEYISGLASLQNNYLNSNVNQNSVQMNR